ncbi:MAG: RsmE family RNA methyltransferase [Planctomycetota bacterium]
MSVPRFYLPEMPANGLVELSSADSLHASNVLRLGAGQHVQLFDGVGGRAEGVIRQVAKKCVQVEYEQRVEFPEQQSPNLHLGVSLPKGDRQKVLIDGLTQLGVATLTPILSRRSVAQPAEKSLQRLQRSVIEACKQCGRDRLMQINEPQRIEDVVGGSLAADSESEGLTTLKFFAHPYGNTVSVAALLRDSGFAAASESKDSVASHAAVCLIGPEGGWTDKECQTLEERGFRRVSLGGNILRIEMAALSIASVVLNSHVA